MKPIPKVLVVDDNEYVRRKLRRILSPFGCDFFEAATETEALALISEHAFRVIFLDIRLPFGATGTDLFRKAKEIRRSDLGKVIILTGWLEDKNRAEVIELGAFAWLDKAPLDQNKITDAFLRALEEGDRHPI